MEHMYAAVEVSVRLVSSSLFLMEAHFTTAKIMGKIVQQLAHTRVLTSTCQSQSLGR